MTKVNSSLIYRFDGNEFEVLFKQPANCKRTTLRVNMKRQIVVSYSKRTSFKVAERFFADNSNWINMQLAKFSDSIIDDNEIKDGMIINLVGNPYLVLRFSDQVKDFLIKKDEKQLLLDSKDPKKALKMFYKSMAVQIFKHRVAHYSDVLGLEFSRISIRDQDTRWGSCSSSKVLSFSWRVVLAPKEVIDYLVLHEVCHLKYMNHSKYFWGLVESVMPNYKKYDKWLKVHGLKLKGFLI